MKKLISILLAFAVFSFCFVFAEEDYDDFQDMQDLFIQSLNNIEANSAFLDALDESNEIIEEENSRIEEEKKQAERKKELEKEMEKEAKERLRSMKSKNNTMVSAVSFGGNVPFALSANSPTNELGSVPFGILLQYTGSSYFWSTKFNLNWDFIKYADNNSPHFIWTASLGISPVHNDYCFIGFYGTIGSDKIENYSYTSYGGSIDMMFYFTERFGLSLNLDATCRGKAEYKGDEEIPPYLPLYTDSWRISPSIGFVFTFING